MGNLKIGYKILKQSDNAELVRNHLIGIVFKYNNNKSTCYAGKNEEKQ